MSIVLLARDLGLSISTVSRALNGYDDVSQATRERIVKRARELGYKPNPGARRLKSGRSSMVGVILPSAGDGVRSSERHTMLASEMIGELRQRRASRASASRHASDIELGPAHRRTDQRHGSSGIAKHRGDERLQIVLGVDDVAEGRVVDRGENRLGLAERLAADGCPTALLPIARACSSATGFRFCGMIVLDWTKPSASRRYPTSTVHHRSRSWTTRPRPVVSTAAADALSRR